jgi:hypothetical protein
MDSAADGVEAERSGASLHLLRDSFNPGTGAHQVPLELSRVSLEVMLGPEHPFV